MPGLYWSFTPEEAKPAARILIQHEDERGTKPILVAGQYGSGRTVYMGFNGTWRWRKIGHNAEFFKKFWDQTTKYLIEGRSTEGQRRGYVEVKDRYQLGEKVDIAVRELKDENFNLYSATRSEIQVTVQPEGGGQPATVTLRKGSEEDRDFHGSYTPRATGKHLVKVIMPEGAGTPPKIETNFSVIRPTIETNEVALNKPLLVDIATLSNGAYFDIDEIQKLPARIPPKTKESEYRSKPRLLWDTNRMLLLLVVLLTGEWALRKGFKLL
jgi:hypothetical protein